MPNTTIHYNFKKPKLSEAADIEVINENMDVIDSELYNKQNKSARMAMTLSASLWSGANAPFQYTLAVPGVLPENGTNQEVYQPANPTVAQVEAYNAAIFRDGGQTTDQITILAYGDKPLIDIPIIVEVKVL